MSMSRIFVSFVLLCAITVSCEEDSLMSPIAIPEIVDTSIDLNGTDIVLSGKVSDGDRIKECGFYFGRSEDEMEMLPTDLPVDKEFTVTLKGMAEPGNMYFCRSFIVAGEDTIKSGLNSVKADYRPPIVTIDSLKLSGPMMTQYDDYYYICECYYSVKDDFSGELFKTGLCWGTSESPTIDATDKTYSYGLSNNGGIKLCAYAPNMGSTFYFRAFAISNVGITYSDEASAYIPVFP